MVRLCGLIAVSTGIFSWFAGSVLLLHIAPGSLLAISLFTLAIQGHSVMRGLSALGIVIAVLTPLLGLLELRPCLGNMQWTLMWFHPIVGVGGIAVAELLTKRIKAVRKV